ncbi:FAD-binding oxidoreductase [Mangrovimicrobium sediminis]|uniref:FAD-binding oxidoreductase n=1 Tax=Mangrovimicrobium sediminis TaxID=2562682 RepID=A0A4Z0LZI4_9GAMM|nr:FAD-dependent oxidoreductase [Haliea sp. SAOS-164]TGD72596.1 FAD-binding oxidoreductase [Haliea sp. SAOS-164]
MKVAIIGAGLAGTSAAQALTLQGIEVDLFDARPGPMHGASRWNEGKLHLGYVFAKDRSLATASAMIEGSCSFFPILRTLFGEQVPARTSRPFTYDVIASGQLTPDAVRAQFAAIDQLLAAQPALAAGYPAPLWPSSDAPSASGRTSEQVQASLLTPEVCIEIHSLSTWLRRALADNPRLRVFGDSRVQRIERLADERFALHGNLPPDLPRYSHVINAAWEGRLALDESVAHPLPPDWNFRYKLAIHFRDIPADFDLPPCTGVLGEYGDAVYFPDGTFYLSWYPACRMLFSRDVLPPGIEDPQGTEADKLFDEALTGACSLWPQLDRLREYRDHAVIRGGYIYTRGGTDIKDPDSLLHTRDRIGLTATGNYLSVDTGKLCTAPLMGLLAAAEVCPQWGDAVEALRRGAAVECDAPVA